MELQQYSKPYSRSSTLASSFGTVIQIETARLEEAKTKSTVKTEKIIFPSHIIYLTEGSKRKEEKGEKTGKILSCPPIFHLLCAHPSWVNLLIWSCHRLGNSDLQPLETNDLAREGQQLMARGVTLLSCWVITLYCRSGFETSGLSCFQENFSDDRRWASWDIEQSNKRPILKKI